MRGHHRAQQQRMLALRPEQRHVRGQGWSWQSCCFCGRGPELDAMWEYAYTSWVCDDCKADVERDGTATRRRNAGMTDRAAWLKERRTGIGSSDAPIIAGVSPYGSLFSLWADKVGLSESDPVEQEWMEWGIRLEPAIAEKYAEESQRVVIDPGRYTIRRHPERPWLLATVDRNVAMDFASSPTAVLECKTTAFWNADDWADGPPLAYVVQLQHQLAVTGYTWGSLAVLIGGQRFRWCDVERNDAFIDVLLEREYAFWQRVQSGDPPSPDGSDRTKDVLAKLYPTHTPGVTVALPPAAMDWDAQREEASKYLAYWEEKKREADNQIRGAIGSAERGELPNGVAFSWKTHERAAYTVEAQTIRTLRRHAGKELKA